MRNLINFLGLGLAAIFLAAAAPSPNSPTMGGFSVNQLAGGLAVAKNVPLEGVYAVGQGPLLDMCPGYDFGCPAVGKIRAQLASTGTSLGDAGTQESEFYSYIVNKTGEALPWAANKTYTAGQAVQSDNGLFSNTVGNCTTGNSGPTGKGTAVADGTCSWNYIGEPGLRGKIAIAATTLVLPGGTDAWAGVFDTFVEPGWAEGFATGMEVDMTNLSGRDADGNGLTMPLLYLGGSVGTQPITAYVHISPFGLMGTNFMSHEGVYVQGQYTILGHDFRVSTHSLAAFFDDGASVHGTASYFDASTSPSGILLEGKYASGNALVADNSIAAVQTSPGANFTGFTVSNFGTTPNTDANILLNTGSPNSFARIDLFDSNSLNFLTGSALTTGITLGTLAGPINLNPHTTLNINGTPGVSCGGNGVSLATFVVNDGIVTHC